MRRAAYFIAGALLLPLAVAVTRSVMTLLLEIDSSNLGRVQHGAWWLAGGFFLWLVLFFALSRPVRTYVLAHELTHAFWGFLMGAKVSKLRVSARGGSVTLSKTNFLITLAPYFFPFYTILALALFVVLSQFWNLETYAPFWLGLVGLTWSFHVTFTLATLLQHQPDIHEHGRLFSYVVIYVFNLLGIGLWIVAVSGPTLSFFSGDVSRETADVYRVCAAVAVTLWARVRP